MNKFTRVVDRLWERLLRTAWIIFLFVFIQFLNILGRNLDKQVEEGEHEIRMVNRKIQRKNASY